MSEEPPDWYDRQPMQPWEDFIQWDPWKFQYRVPKPPKKSNRRYNEVT